MSSSTRTAKAERDKTRQRAGNKHRKRLHVLRNPNKLAFKGWEEVQEPWTYDDCANYIEWCHIDKAFPEERHNFHRRFHKANLKYCTDEAFKNRCIEVYQVLYDLPTVKRNEVHLFIARGVHAEVKLGKTVDWSTLKAAGESLKIPTPANGFIPTGVWKYPNGGLGKLRTMIDPVDRYETEASSTDSDSDGTHTHFTLSHRSQVRAQRRRAERAGPILVNDDHQGYRAYDEPAIGLPVPVDEMETVESLTYRLEQKHAELETLYAEVRNFRQGLGEKFLVIEAVQREIQDIRLALEALG